jgi:hypothetical protein
MLQAMTLHYFFLKRNGAPFAAADLLRSALGYVQIFKVFQMPQDRFASVVGFCAPRGSGQLVESFFDGLRKSDS